MQRHLKKLLQSKILLLNVISNPAHMAGFFISQRILWLMSKSRNLQDWLDAYGESHQHPTNKLIHWICVPIIAYSILALSSMVSFSGIPLNLGHLLVLLAFIFYIRLSISMAWAMLLFGALCLLIARSASNGPLPLWESSISLFIAAWLGQFYGHKLEGKKPSFLKDIQFLLIGPAWLMSDLFRKFGLKY